MKCLTHTEAAVLYRFAFDLCSYLQFNCLYPQTNTRNAVRRYLAQGRYFGWYTTPDKTPISTYFA